MATYQEVKDGLKVCPYDSTHLIKESRYPMHLAKCEKNHLDAHNTTCPFNAQHRPENAELNYHLLNCECRKAVDKQLIASNDDTYRGHVGVPSYQSQHVETDENWDDEIQNPRQGYVPSAEPPTGGMRTDFSRMKQSERKKYYKALHHKNDAESEEKPEKTTNPPELREPKTLSYAQMLDKRKPVHELQNIGLGRGQPSAASSSRIAANIFSQPAPMRQPKTTPHIPGFQNPSLGLGRGSRRTNNDTDTSLTGLDLDAFPPLGRGQGKRT